VTFVVCLIFLSPVSWAQVERSGSTETASLIRDAEPGILSKVSLGFAHSLRTWDLSLIGLGVLRRLKPDEQDDQIDFAPLRLDNEFTRLVVRNDEGQLLGSRVHPVKIQSWIFFGQLGLTAFVDAFTDARINSREYQKPFVFAKAMVYTFGITEITKDWVHRRRPDGSDSKSFFSGHTSGSFAAAAFVYREISDWTDGMALQQSARPVLKVAAFSLCYGWAAYVGYARIHDRKHYLSDALIGATVGTLIGNLMYDWHFDTSDDGQTDFHLSFLPSTYPSLGITYYF
jgi:hypothetical protein